MILLKRKPKAGPRSYYDHCRQDILSFIPSGVRSVLSIGCGAGATEAELVRRGVKVVGVELDPIAAARARERGIAVIRGDAATVDIEPYGPFDCIIYADVLEHLTCDPLCVLQRNIESLRPGGTVCISVPNFSHYSVIWQLAVLHHIHYTDAGILDKTHHWWTTRAMAMEWFRGAGLTPVDCRYVIPGRRDRLISACLFGLARDFMAKQVCLVGRKVE